MSDFSAHVPSRGLTLAYVLMMGITWKEEKEMMYTCQGMPGGRLTMRGLYAPRVKALGCNQIIPTFHPSSVHPQLQE